MVIIISSSIVFVFLLWVVYFHRAFGLLYDGCYKGLRRGLLAGLQVILVARISSALRL